MIQAQVFTMKLSMDINSIYYILKILLKYKIVECYPCLI